MKRTAKTCIFDLGKVYKYLLTHIEWLSCRTSKAPGSNDVLVDSHMFWWENVKVK